MFNRVLNTLEKSSNLELSYFCLSIFFAHFSINNQAKVPGGGGGTCSVCVCVCVCVEGGDSCVGNNHFFERDACPRISFSYLQK